MEVVRLDQGSVFTFHHLTALALGFECDSSLILQSGWLLASFI